MTPPEISETPEISLSSITSPKPLEAQVMASIAHYSRKIGRSIVHVLLPAISLSQAHCVILDDKEENTGQTCLDPSPKCQALCGEEDLFPQTVGCSRTMPQQNYFLKILNSKTCNDWRETFIYDSHSLRITPDMVGIHPVEKTPCLY